MRTLEIGVMDSTGKELEIYTNGVWYQYFTNEEGYQLFSMVSFSVGLYGVQFDCHHSTATENSYNATFEVYYEFNLLPP